MHDKEIESLLAEASKRDTPEPEFEASLLARAEAEFASGRSADTPEERQDTGTDAGISDEHGEPREIEVSPIGHLPTRQGRTLQRALLTAAALVGVLFGYAFYQGEGSVETDVGGATSNVSTPTIVRPEESSSALAGPSAIDQVDAACLDILPSLPPGVRDIHPSDDPAVTRPPLDDLLLIIQALEGPITAISGDHPDLIEAFLSIEFELSNDLLLIERGGTNIARYSGPRLTAEMDELLDALVTVGAPSCSRWR